VVCACSPVSDYGLTGRPGDTLQRTALLMDISAAVNLSDVMRASHALQKASSLSWHTVCWDLNMCDVA
jgi:hypothetical protein